MSEQRAKQAAYEAEASAWKAERPRAPYDRGTGGPVRPGETLAAMMARLARDTKRTWKAPAVREVNVCDNCDGAPDGGHTGDERCVMYGEDL